MARDDADVTKKAHRTTKKTDRKIPKRTHIDNCFLTALQISPQDMCSRWVGGSVAVYVAPHQTRISSSLTSLDIAELRQSQVWR